MQTLTTLDDLDAKLQECHAAGQVSDDALREVFRTFQMDFSGELPADPFDPTYAAAQMGIYERISGRRYALANEATPFDLEQAGRRPFPYNTGSCGTAGQHLSAIGFLLRTMQLAPGGRVLEFGPGWGNTTLALAQLGFDVTAVDVEPRFCELIRRRAALVGATVTAINSDFFWAESARERFDAVVFFECFHHCADHGRLLRALHGVLAESGRLYFGAEPIVDDYPVPWGVRMDGESLWAIRSNGWLELGFRTDYFRQALHRAGWAARKHVSDFVGGTVWEAWRRDAGPFRVPAADPRLHTVTGVKDAGGIRLRGGATGYGLFGPYVPLGPGRYLGRVLFAADAPRAGRFVLDVAAQNGQQVLASVAHDAAAIPPGDGAAAVEFALDAWEDAVELRVLCDGDVCGLITGIEIVECN
jgi:SAM-dependent methyltransferase